MKAHTRQRHGDRRLRLWGMLLVASALILGVSSAGTQERQFRVAVLASRLNAAVLDGLREGLAPLGYREGKNIVLVVEAAQGEVDNLAGLATRLVEDKPDVMFTISTASAVAAKQVTTTLPIVFTMVGDPLRSGLIASYASSQNNLTGITNAAGPLSGKRLEILQETAPGIRRVLVLVAPQEIAAKVSFQFLAEVAPKLGIELLRYDVSSKEEIEQVLKAVPKGTVDAIFHVPSSLVATNLDLLIRKAEEDRIPLSVHEHSLVEQGALMSYGADLRLLGVQAAKLVAKIIQGAKPSDLPIQTPEPLLLTLNLTTAKAIGLNIPRQILERTDRFVE